MSNSPFSIFPCFDPNAQRWFCEITFTETGTTHSVTEFKHTRRGAVTEAKLIIKGILANPDRARQLGLAA